MKHSFYVLTLISLILLTCSNITSAKDQPILTVDSGGHKGIIREIAITSDKRYAVSASDDKTIRIWDLRSQKEVRKILGQIGHGSEGKIFAIALSPDDKYLAVGGWLHKKCHGRCGDIRIFDFASGELIKRLDSHRN